MSQSNTSMKASAVSNPPPPRISGGHGGHGAAYDPYYGDMLDAIQYSSVEDSIQLFSRRGYDVNTEVEYVFDDGKKYNVTPLHWAVRYRKTRLCKYLLEHGARPFNNLVFEYYPLHEASSRGFTDVLRVFVEAKVDLNKATPDKDTALHIASMRGHIECVHLLLDAGADRSICNKAGRTPIQEAMYQHHDDLIHLFQVYPDSGKAPRIKRRLSLGSHRPPLRQQESSPASIPCRRPKSVYCEQGTGCYEPSGSSSSQVLLTTVPPGGMFVPATTRSHSHQDLALSSAPPPRSSAGSLSARPAADHLHAPTKIILPCSSSSSVPLQNFSSYSLSTSKPSLVKQLSIASSSAAESPSPVERDGVGRMLFNSSAPGGHGNKPVSGNCTLPAKPTVSSNSEPVGSVVSGGSRMIRSTSPTKHVTKSTAPPQTSSTIGPSYRDTTPAVYLHTPYFPVTSSASSLSVLRHHQSKLQYRLMGSVSNPEFPVLPEVMVTHEKRTQSSSNLYDRGAKVSLAPIETQSVSPSREMINSLSQHIYSSFETTNYPTTSLSYVSIYDSSQKPYNMENSSSGGGGGGANLSGCSISSHPAYDVVHRVLCEMSVRVKLTPEHLQSVIDSVHSSSSNLSPERRPDSVCNISTSLAHSIGVEPCAETVLKSKDVEVENQPFDVKYSLPAPGYMTLQYRATMKKSTSANSATKQHTEDCHVLKAVVKVFNLKSWSESSEYHSQNLPAVVTSSAGIGTSTVALPTNVSSSSDFLSLTRPLQEVATLQKLSSSLHPNIGHMIHHFRATTSDQCHMLARKFDSDNPQAVYTAGHTTDFLLLQSSTLSLSQHFDNLRKNHCGVVPETEVLVTIAQLNLGIAHLVKNQISHCCITPENVYVNKESNRMLLANFSQSIQFIEDLSSMKEVQSQLRTKLRSKCVKLCLSPEVLEWVEETETGYCLVQENMRTLFTTNDSYAAAHLIYSLLLGESHDFVKQLVATSRQQRDSDSFYMSPTLPQISSLSPQCNHLLQKLVSPNLCERLKPIEAAMASLMLLFGPRPLQIQSLEDCHRWLLAETMQLYMRPVLTDSNNSDICEIHKWLLCVYLTVANTAPCLVWKMCSFFKHLSV